VEPRLEAVHPVLGSRDIRRTIRFYERLGFAFRGQDDPGNPRYAVLSRDAVELHFQWHDAKEWDGVSDRPTYRFLVQDVDALFSRFRADLGDADLRLLGETPWGTYEFHLRDPDGNGLQFYRDR
jgi:catechol 2,3-dioxygenase-like lactoylglutathione lyase family enzyme